MTDRNVDEWPLLGKRMFVSRRLHEQDTRPGFVYREPPDDDDDSGWRALVGDESQDEVDDPGSILVHPVGFMLDRWPELRAVLETDPKLGAWAWDAATEQFVPHEDTGV
jgi:hypothetical protein